MREQRRIGGGLSRRSGGFILLQVCPALYGDVTSPLVQRKSDPRHVNRNPETRV